MPDPNEIAAAAERLRQNPDHHNLDQCRRIYGKAPANWRNENPEPVEIDGVDYTYTGTLEAIWYGQKIDADRKTLAAAYLDEHADEPVTREWLVGVLGFAGETDVEGDCRWRETMYADCRIVYYAEGDEYVGYLCNDEPEFADANVVLETRGDVLAFLRLVRWPLKGGSDG